MTTPIYPSVTDELLAELESAAKAMHTPAEDVNDSIAAYHTYHQMTNATVMLALIARIREQPQVPEGYKLVPIEPTIEMLAALGFDGDVDLTIGHAAITAEMAAAYSAMLSAAPEPPPCST